MIERIAVMRQIHKLVQTKRTLCWSLVIALVSQSFASCAGGNFLGIGIGNKYLYTYRMIAPVDSRKLLIQDANVKAQFKFDDSAIHFQLQNLSRSNLSILWDQVSLGVDNKFTPVRNSVNFYLDTVRLGGSQSLPPLGYVQEIVIPYHNIRFDGIRWVEKDLFPTTAKADLANAIMKNLGKSIKLVLPLRIGSEMKTYVFEFVVESVHQIAWNDYRPQRRKPPPIAKKPQKSVTDQVTIAIIAVGLLGFAAYAITLKKDPISE